MIASAFDNWQTTLINWMMVRLDHIVKLVGEDQWSTWKSQVRLALSDADVMGLLDGTITSENVEFKPKNATARWIIGSTVGEVPVLLIRNCGTAKDMWDTLVGVYDKEDDHMKQQLLEKLWNFHIHQGEEIVQAIARLNNIVAALARDGEVIPDSVKITSLLSALSAEYKLFCSAWDSTPEVSKTYEDLIQRLTLDEERRILSKKMASGALIMESRELSCGGNEVQKGSQAKKTVRCYKCKQKGHVIANCPCWPKNTEESVALSSVCGQLYDARWCLDAGATDHMCPDRSLFKNYKPLGKKVMMTNGTVMHAIGVGDVSVLAFDGKTWKERMLMNTLHVPESKFYLFSMARTLEKDCIMRADGSECAFHRGSEIVAVGRKQGTLYYMMLKDNSKSGSREAQKDSGNGSEIISLMSFAESKGKRQDAKVVRDCRRLKKTSMGTKKNGPELNSNRINDDSSSVGEEQESVKTKPIRRGRNKKTERPRICFEKDQKRRMAENSIQNDSVDDRDSRRRERSREGQCRRKISKSKNPVYRRSRGSSSGCRSCYPRRIKVAVVDYSSESKRRVSEKEGPRKTQRASPKKPNSTGTWKKTPCVERMPVCKKPEMIKKQVLLCVACSAGVLEMNIATMKNKTY